MLGTKINPTIYNYIGKRVTLYEGFDGRDEGSIEVEVIDVVNGQVIYEHFSGERGAISIEEFEKQIL